MKNSSPLSASCQSVGPRLMTVALLLSSISTTSVKADSLYGLSADREVATNPAALNEVNPMLCGYSNATGKNVVVVFQLPTLPTGKEFSAVSLRLYYQRKDATPTYNGDLYGLGVAASSTVLTTDYYAGTLDRNALLIQDNFITPSTALGPLISTVPALTDYLNTAYANGAGAGQYLFFRLSPAIAGLTSNYSRYGISSAETSGSDYQPLLTYNVADIVPTTVGNLTINGAIDVAGNISSFGTEGTTAGVSLIYTPGSIASVDFSASSSSANWGWSQGTSLQLELSTANVLSLFNPATGTEGVTLNPAGVSTFTTASGSGITTEFLRLLSSGASTPNTGQRISGRGDVLNAYIDFKRFATAGPVTGLTLGTLGGDVLTIRSSGSTDAGNVGIGTNTPAAKLDVAGNVNVQGNLTVTGSVSLPNQAVTGANSILTLSLADSRYLLNGTLGSVAMSGSYASGINSTAMSFGITDSDYSTAMSFGTTYGHCSTAMSLATASGDYSTAMSCGTTYGYWSTAMSLGTASGDFSTAMSWATANGLASTAMGFGIQAQGMGQVVVGTNNVPQGDLRSWLPADDLFVVGNGSVDDSYLVLGPPSNALVVRKNGDTRVAGNLQVKGGIRVAPGGDISMGDFHTGDNPAALNNGLRYESE